MDHVHQGPATFGRIGLAPRHAEAFYADVHAPIAIARHVALWVVPLLAFLSCLAAGLPLWLAPDFSVVNVLGATILLSASHALAGVAVYLVAAYGPPRARRNVIAAALWNAAVAPNFGFGREDRGQRRSRDQIARLNQDVPTDALARAIARERLLGWTTAAFAALICGLVLARI